MTLTQPDGSRLIELFYGFRVFAQLLPGETEGRERNAFLKAILDLSGDCQRLFIVIDGLVALALTPNRPNQERSRWQAPSARFPLTGDVQGLHKIGESTLITTNSELNHSENSES
jgi:hypothetical protein